MGPEDAEILHVSDTALMAAGCRALETVRPDGLVRDPFAERLAGARGMAIARGLPRLEIMCFGVGMRSHFLDRMVLHAIEQRKIATVLSLGSGLDTRPWRLDLPPHLHWIEVDLAAMLEYKAGILAPEPPKCRLEQRAADLNDAAQRRALFAAVDSGPALLITEGLLMYLPAATVQGLADDAAPSTGTRYWLLDVTSAEMAQMIGMSSFQGVQNVRAAGYLHGDQILDALRENGWTHLVRSSYITDAWVVAKDRILAMTGGRMQPPPPDVPDRSGVHLMGFNAAAVSGT